jgi:Zn-dependent metalloprotease
MKLIGHGDKKDYREKRNKIVAQIRRGETPDISIPREHTERLVIYDNKNQWDYIKDKIWDDFTQDHTVSQYKRPRRLFTKDMDKIYDMFHDLLNRESFDNQNAFVQIFLNLGVDYNNAFWDGEYLAFGNGDGVIFNDFSKCFDVLAHELGHAVTQYESNLEYANQSGALNEHVSDVFGICAYHKKYNISVKKSRWIIGEKLLAKGVRGVGLRTFTDQIAYDDPIMGRDEQPKHMSNYMDLPNTEEGDWGGVHINSGIPNKAFYLFNMKLGGYTWKNDSLKIWYNTILKENGLPATNATFKEFAAKTLEMSDKINPNVTSKLAQSWQEVGIIS